MGMAYGTRKETRNAYKGLAGTFYGRRIRGRTGCRWEDNIVIYFEEEVYWIHLASSHIWDLWSMKWPRGRFSLRTWFSFASNHSTNAPCSTIIMIIIIIIIGDPFEVTLPRYSVSHLSPPYKARTEF
jgi:hypothetical protein